MRASAHNGRLAGAIVLLLGATLAASASAGANASAQTRTSTSAALAIRHETHGCHAWSLNSGRYKARQVARIARGGFVTVTNTDLMAQELVKKGGPPVKMSLLGPVGHSQVMKGQGMGKAGPSTMSHMGARLRVSFPKAGTYRFVVMDRGDYVKVKTIGEDNELTLTVVVS